MTTWICTYGALIAIQYDGRHRRYRYLVPIGSEDTIVPGPWETLILGLPVSRTTLATLGYREVRA